MPRGASAALHYNQFCELPAQPLCPNFMVNSFSRFALPAGNSQEGFTITRDFVMAMLECFRKQQKIHRRFAFQILLEVSCPPVMPCMFCGCLHPTEVAAFLTSLEGCQRTTCTS